MREILFRGKDIDGKWVEGCCIVDEMDTSKVYIGYIFGSDGRQPHDIDVVMVDPETVCQYTGLTDRNGRKIFEGDIVKTSQYGVDDGKGHNFAGFDKFSVEFYDGSFCLKNKWRRFNFRPQRDFEVCGNIFDNPDLTGE